MKKKKLALKELKVRSFLTKIPAKKEHTLKGGETYGSECMGPASTSSICSLFGPNCTG